MLRIAVPVLAVLAIGHAATAQSHGFKAHSASETSVLVSEQTAACVTPPPLRELPDSVTLISEDD